MKIEASLVWADQGSPGDVELDLLILISLAYNDPEKSPYPLDMGSPCDLVVEAVYLSLVPVFG